MSHGTGPTRCFLDDHRVRQAENHFVHPPRQLVEESVRVFVAQGLVDVIKPPEMDQDQSEAAVPRAIHPLDAPSKHHFQQVALRQAGQAVVPGLLTEVLRHGFTFLDRVQPGPLFVVQTLAEGKGENHGLRDGAQLHPVPGQTIRRSNASHQKHPPH